MLTFGYSDTGIGELYTNTILLWATINKGVVTAPYETIEDGEGKVAWGGEGDI